MRCFISIELPENVRSQIFHSFEKLKNSKLGFGNFVDKNNLHLTLKFLGDLSEDKIELVKKALSEVEFRQFSVETGELGFFPNEKFIKILWLDLISPEFEFLKKSIDDKLQKLGFNEKEKDFVAHLTLTRIKKIDNKEAFLEKVQEIAPKKMFFVANQFSLMKSILKKNGPEYKILAEFPMRMRA